MQTYTKASLIDRLKQIAAHGWIPNARHGNSGGIGNTLEDLLGIQENNLPIPNAAEWELKTQRLGSSSLTTLFHMEPSPTALKIVPLMLLPKYGWAHQQAGLLYPEAELSFRQTINGMTPSDRGFMVQIDRDERKVRVSFDASTVDIRHAAWLETVQQRASLDELDPQPYWGFDDLKHKAGTKLLNCFYVQAEVKREENREFYWYKKVLMLRGFNFEGFLQALDEAILLVDFDARSGHNHGTKFRLRQNHLPMLYADATEVINIEVPVL